MSNNSTNRTDLLSNAELGQPNGSPQDENTSPQETSALLGSRRRPSTNSQNGKRLSGNSKRSLTDHARKKIIIALTSISGALLIILALTLVHKMGSAPSKCFYLLLMLVLRSEAIPSTCYRHYILHQLTHFLPHQL